MFRLSLQRRCHSFTRNFSSLPAHVSAAPVVEEPTYNLKEVARRKRRTEWKRRQGGQTFLDHLIVHVRSGKGGDGCVAFHRELYKPFGPPSGGNGGRGGDVYFLPTPHLTTLSSVPSRVRGNPGSHGQGTWQGGRNGAPLVVKVPLGTVVRELTKEETAKYNFKDEWEAEEEALADLSPEERLDKLRAKRWVHYPRYQDDNVQRAEFKEAERTLWKEERARRIERKRRTLNPLFLDLDTAEDTTLPDDSPLGPGNRESLGHLIASGGAGGLGNPNFLSANHRSPKFATRGHEGELVVLSLELKILADIGLVGMPNAGKSTLLRALTGGRAKSEVASYAFTTLNPVVGVIRVANDGIFEGWRGEGAVHDETRIEEERHLELMEQGAFADSLTRNQKPIGADDGDTARVGHDFDLIEEFRFTIADNPGLISRASEDVGLGYSFLRSMERSLALVYVVDFSGPAPWDELRVLRDELEAYQHGMSARARMVIANKADLLGGDGRDPQMIEDAKRKLGKLAEFVEDELGPLDVIPVSSKFSNNLTKVVGFMRGYVEDARERLKESREPENE
ncbi:GTP-binding protein Obg/CgtA [Thelephora ganbajun]|uniref:GTP-binding protein Obg/CgtA n=1 Tax=Thelephora ganbajun TaxID=370292 RepID=A0ACB6ZJA0_THEGA|nr:GTP-binding protein Obg/CgtA [Thelephora ganbajun]